MGFTKQSIREFLFEHSKVPLEEMRKTGCMAWMEIAATEAARESAQQDPWPIAQKAATIGLVVAGGGHSSHALWLQAYTYGVIGREIKLPAAFGELVTGTAGVQAAAP